MSTDTQRTAPGAATTAAGVPEPERNCWRVETSSRTRCIRDAAEYFRLAREAILRAEHSVFLLGWDILANLDLLPGESAPGAPPTRLAELLDHVVRRRRRLVCHVLVWDHSALYALERDPFTRLKLGWLTHRRVRFRFDDRHPIGASHHSKVLVVDDSVAFAGSIDLTTHRWDTSAHRLDEPHRRNAFGQPYGPYHDVQLMVEGAAARALGEFARDRWRRLGRVRLPAVAATRDTLWPDGVDSDLPPVPVAISRTEPAFGGRTAIRECEAMFFDSIAAARRCIYVENQYLTEARIGDALAARLREHGGPEIFAVVPDKCSGWLERNTMGLLRSAIVTKLRAADGEGRLRLLCPMASVRASVATFVHSKVMVVDDELLRIGSANLAARSMGVDSECDLTVVGADPAARRGIAAVLDELLAEHLGVAAAEVHAERQRHGSLIAAVDALAHGDRTLVPLGDAPPESGIATAETVRSLADPLEPIGFGDDLRAMLPEIEVAELRARRFARLLPVAVVGIAVLAFWRSESADVARYLSDLDATLASAATSPAVRAAAVLAFVVAGCTFLPLNLMTLAAAVLLGGFRGAVCAAFGATLAAAIAHGVGRWLGPRRLAGWIGHRVYRMARLVQRPSHWSIAALRLIPVASTTTIGLVCGAAGTRAATYWTGTLLGLLPPIALVGAAGHLLRRALLEDDWRLGIAGALFVALLVWVMLRLRQRLLQQHVDRALVRHGELARFG